MSIVVMILGAAIVGVGGYQWFLEYQKNKEVCQQWERHTLGKNQLEVIEHIREQGLGLQYEQGQHIYIPRDHITLKIKDGIICKVI